jgi:hypothetical protein
LWESIFTHKFERLDIESLRLCNNIWQYLSFKA